jgi:hypothetical protein
MLWLSPHWFTALLLVSLDPDSASDCMQGADAIESLLWVGSCLI